MQAVRGLVLVTRPLTPLQFTAVAGSVILIAAAYCLAHGLVGNDEINLPRTLAWAIASTLPWACAWEGMKRLRTLWVALLIAAFVIHAALDYALSLAYPGDAVSLAAILYRLLPIPFGVAAARLLLQTERPRESQVEPVLSVQTRGGTVAVRACDVEYVKAAGNYVELMTGGRPLLMRATLHDLGEELRQVGFVRVHRSLLVNARHVLATRRGPGGRQFLRLSSGVELPVGRQFNDSLRAFVPTPPS